MPAGPVRSTALDEICDELEVELCLVRLQHLAARNRLGLDDAAENRAAEAVWRARLDVILDVLVELKGGAAGRGAARHSRRRRPASARGGPPADGVVFRAAAALPNGDRLCAAEALRHQLHVMAAAAEATPDWTTLTLTGPTEMPGADAMTRFEWRASVAVHGATTLEALLSVDADPRGCPPSG